MKNRKGQILIVVFSLLLMVSILVAGTALMWQSGVNNANLARDSLRAFYIAQAGLERGRAEIAVAVDDNYEHVFSNQPFGGGHYDLVISKVDVKTKDIVSTGRYANCTREIKMEVARSNSGGPPHGNAWGYHAKNGDTWIEQ